MKQIRMLSITILFTILFFCLIHSSGFAYNDSNLPRIVAGEPGKFTGEVILPLTIEEVAAWCDFNKTIILTNRGYLCVFSGKPFIPAP